MERIRANSAAFHIEATRDFSVAAELPWFVALHQTAGIPVLLMSTAEMLIYFHV